MNTNRLMWKKGFIGGKTGQTNGAGACLVNVFEDEGKKYFIIVLGC
jgi:D-alanyl-D-alanine carboxypeptidase